MATEKLYFRTFYGTPCVESLAPAATKILLAMDAAAGGVLNDQGNPGGVEGGRSFLPETEDLARAAIAFVEAALNAAPAEHVKVTNITRTTLFRGEAVR